MSSDWLAWVNGTWGSAADARVGVLDHGLLYGDGVFEGIRFYGREPFLLDEHLARLEASARALALELPLDRAGFAELCWEGARRSATDDGYLRLVVTRGPGALGVSPHTCVSGPTTILIAAPLALYSEEARLAGVKLVTSSLRRSAADALPPQVKSLNYLTSVLASIEARRQGAEEAILLNAQGLIAECTADNLFAVQGGVVRTPAVTDGALRGITRDLVLRLLADLGIPAEEAPLVPVDAWTADELFLTGTGAEIVRVREVDGRPVGEAGRPITERVERAFADYVATGPWRRTKEAVGR
jgi:branched-chain amino acid aminotransferase